MVNITDVHLCGFNLKLRGMLVSLTMRTVWWIGETEWVDCDVMRMSSVCDTVSGLTSPNPNPNPK